MSERRTPTSGPTALAMPQTLPIKPENLPRCSRVTISLQMGKGLAQVWRARADAPDDDLRELDDPAACAYR
jgi:hypothetical protein